MRQHPITPVSEPLQYRAIGMVRGRYVPADHEHFNRGIIHTTDGSEIGAVVLGRLINLMERHLDMREPHLWVVYPRYRQEQHLHLQMVGVWEPSTLSNTRNRTDVSDVLPDEPPEGDGYFSVRGELVYTRPESADLVVKIRQQSRADGTRPIPFKLPLKGEIPLENLRHFVSLDLRRQHQQLTIEHYEVMGPVAQRGNRGGKSRKKAVNDRNQPVRKISQRSKVTSRPHP